MILKVHLSCKFRLWGFTLGTVSPDDWNLPLSVPPGTLQAKTYINFNERGVTLVVSII